MFALLLSLDLLAWELVEPVLLLWTAPSAGCLVSFGKVLTYISISGVRFVILALTGRASYAALFVT